MTASPYVFDGEGSRELWRDFRLGRCGFDIKGPMGMRGMDVSMGRLIYQRVGEGMELRTTEVPRGEDAEAESLILSIPGQERFGC